MHLAKIAHCILTMKYLYFRNWHYLHCKEHLGSKAKIESLFHETEIQLLFFMQQTNKVSCMISVPLSCIGIGQDKGSDNTQNK